MFLYAKELELLPTDEAVHFAPPVPVLEVVFFVLVMGVVLALFVEVAMFYCKKIE